MTAPTINRGSGAEWDAYLGVTRRKRETSTHGVVTCPLCLKSRLNFDSPHAPRWVDGVLVDCVGQVVEVVAAEPSMSAAPEKDAAAPSISAQAEDLERVTSRIGQAVLGFCRANRQFRADQLRAHVAKECGASAPASADRVLRELKARGAIKYRVVNRSQSLYSIEEG